MVPHCDVVTINNCMWDRALEHVEGETQKDRVANLRKLPKTEQLRRVEAEIESRGGLEKVNADLCTLWQSKEDAKKPAPTYGDFVASGCSMNGSCRCPICMNSSDYR